MWKTKISTLALENVYKHIIFVGIDCEENNYGGTIQKYACEELKIPDKHARSFWNEYGKDIILKSIRKKRQTINTAIKTRFMRKLYKNASKRKT